MLRQTGNEEQVLDRTAEVAATIVEEGLRYASDSALGLSFPWRRCHRYATREYFSQRGFPLQLFLPASVRYRHSISGSAQALLRKSG